MMRPGSTIVTTLALMSSSASARADDVRECIAHAESAQALIEQARYSQALEQITECLRERCPAPLRIDCNDYLREVKQLQPTVVFSVTADDGRVDAVRVREADRVIATRIDGQPVPLDPGRHVLTFEAAGRAPVQRTLVINAGEKARLVEISWRNDVAAGAAGSSDSGSGRRSLSLGPIALGGLSVAGFVTGIAIGALAKSDVSDLHGSPCAATRTCDPKDVDALRTRLAMADVALAIGVVTLGTAIVWGILDLKGQPGGGARTTTSSR